MIGHGREKVMDLKHLKTGRATGLINIIILVAAGATCIACLWAASREISMPIRILAAICFSFVANTMFSLMHEAVHGGFHPSRPVNEFAGRVAAVFFPTAFSLQRAFHLSHHRNNRSAIERFDYYSKDENYFLKVLQWYGILTGLYWASAPLFCVVYAVTAEIVPWPRLFGAGNQFGDQTSARAFLESLREAPVSRVRIDVATSALVQFAIIWSFNVNLLGWSLCYGLFALNWSSLQYADHAFSSLDRHEGAWNLKVNRVVTWMFLNYHYHLGHHRDPSVGWMNLPKLVRTGDPELSYWRLLLCMWTGPRPLPGASEAEGSPARNRGTKNSGLFPTKEEITVNLIVSLVFGLLFCLLYGSGSALFHVATDIHRVDFPFEQAIPFVPWASLVYLTVTPMLMLAPFVLKSPVKLVPFAATLALEVLIAWWIFVLFPVEVSFPAHVISGMSGWFYSIADAINLNGNALPSLHVALSFSAAWAYGAGTGVSTRALYWLWALAISVSTLLTHQHNVLDVAAGIVLATITMACVYSYLQHCLNDDIKQLNIDGGAQA